MQIIKNLVAASLAAGLALAPAAGIAQEARPQAEPAPVTAPAAEAAPVAPAPVAEAPSARPQAATAPAATAQADEADVTIFDQTVERDATLPHNLSPWGMFMAADWVVKAVMIGLAFASLVTWTVWLAKSLELAAARRRLGAHLDRIIGSKTLDEAAGALENRSGPAPLLVRAARHEMQMSSDMLPYGGSAGLKERVASHLSRIEAQASRRMTRGTGVLATIGSTAPFVGLFGTVWGIMNSFIGISESQTTNLAVVAPGIAEALLATALGLVAAIPAVVIYNVFSRSITGYRQALADAAAGVERLVSRDLDFRKVPAAARERLAAG